MEGVCLCQILGEKLAKEDILDQAAIIRCWVNGVDEMLLPQKNAAMIPEGAAYLAGHINLTASLNYSYLRLFSLALWQHMSEVQKGWDTESCHWKAQDLPHGVTECVALLLPCILHVR